MANATRFFPLTVAIAATGLLLISGCGGSGGGSGGSSNDAFSPDAYQEATGAQESLSGIWLLLEEYERHSEWTGNEGQPNTESEETRRRELYVIADADVSPYASPRISGCGEPRNLTVTEDSIYFTRDDAEYQADRRSPTRLNGTSQYSTDDDYQGRAVTQTGTFTLIKLAPLPATFEIDATSDSHEAYYDSYTKYLEPMGTVTIMAETGDRSLSESGPVKCFIHRETRYTETSPDETLRGVITDIWAGAEDSLRVYLYRNAAEGGEPFVEIGADSDLGGFEIDNSIFDEITGTSTVSIQGTMEISAEGSIVGADEGDAEATMDISLP